MFRQSNISSSYILIFPRLQARLEVVSTTRWRCSVGLHCLLSEIDSPTSISFFCCIDASSLSFTVNELCRSKNGPEKVSGNNRRFKLHLTPSFGSLASVSYRHILLNMQFYVFLQKVYNSKRTVTRFGRQAAPQTASDIIQWQIFGVSCIFD